MGACLRVSSSKWESWARKWSQREDQGLRRRLDPLAVANQQARAIVPLLAFALAGRREDSWMLSRGRAQLRVGKPGEEVELAEGGPGAWKNSQPACSFQPTGAKAGWPPRLRAFLRFLGAGEDSSCALSLVSGATKLES